MADVTISIQGLKGLEGKLEKVAQAIASNPKLWGQIGSYESLQILARTAQGIDADNTLFRPYTPAYAKYRTKHGRPTHPADLFFTGSMLNALTYKTKPQEVRLFFKNTTDKFGVRNPEKAYYNNQIRKFFAVSAKDIIAIEKMVQEHITKELHKKASKTDER
jgi:hypothetical protein